MEEQNLDVLADKVADLIVSAKRVVAFTGAVVSTESGIPDFRSPSGIWDRLDPDDYTHQKFVSHPEARQKQWQLLKGRGLTTETKPNPTHYAIAELDSLGKLDCVITQNIDTSTKKPGCLMTKYLNSTAICSGQYVSAVIGVTPWHRLNPGLKPVKKLHIVSFVVIY